MLPEVIRDVTLPIDGPDKCQYPKNVDSGKQSDCGTDPSSPPPLLVEEQYLWRQKLRSDLRQVRRWHRVACHLQTKMPLEAFALFDGKFAPQRNAKKPLA